jgi:malate/lactate dehydrogenase
VVNVIKATTTLGMESKNNKLFDILKSDSVIIEDTKYILDMSNKTIVNSNGIERVIALPLSNEEAIALKQSGEALKNVLKMLDF